MRTPLGLRLAALLVLHAGCLIAGVAAADAARQPLHYGNPLAIANEVRRAGCRVGAGTRDPLRANRTLDAAAARLRQGASLAAALERAGYAADATVSFHLSGRLAHERLRATLAERWCGQLADPKYSEFGAAYGDDELWLVIAAPFSPPPAGRAAEVERRVLALVNAARATGRSCGRTRYAPAPPVRLEPRLTAAALAHSRDMAGHDTFSHVGHDGAQAAERVTRRGYAASRVGENIAAGADRPEDAVDGWLGSPGHCANLMTPEFTEMGVAYAVAPDTRLRIYWTQVFATPARGGG